MAHVNRLRIAALALLLLTGLALAQVARGDVESELNDTRPVADGPLMPGVPWTGALPSANDTDIYRFYVGEGGTQATITFGNTTPVAPGSPGAFQIVAADSDGDIIDTSSTELVDPGETMSLTVNLAAGVYYTAARFYCDFGTCLFADPRTTYTVSIAGANIWPGKDHVNLTVDAAEPVGSGSMTMLHGHATPGVKVSVTVAEREGGAAPLIKTVVAGRNGWALRVKATREAAVTASAGSETAGPATLWVKARFAALAAERRRNGLAVTGHLRPGLTGAPVTIRTAGRKRVVLTVASGHFTARLRGRIRRGAKVTVSTPRDLGSYSSAAKAIKAR
jgi:hypothetical protein